MATAQVVAASFILALVTLIALRFRRSRPYFLVGWFWFLGMLVPVIGLVQVGDQAWADRYTYLPMIGLFVAVVWGVAEKLQAPNPKLQRSSKLQIPSSEDENVATLVTFGGGVALLVVFALLTSIQLRYWKNTKTLFEHAAAVTRNNYMAVTLLGSLSAKEGKLDEAIDCYKTALSWKRDYPEVHFFLGNALDQQGKLDQAIDEYNQALWSKPLQEQTHIFLGAALAKKQQLQQAAAHYRAALKLNPESAVAHNNLARLLQTQGLLDEAMEHYSAALTFDPALAQAHNNLGVVMLMRGKTAEGARELHEALRLNPADPETEYNLAVALNQQRDWSRAAELLANTVQKRPDDANAHYQIAVALAHLQKTREAMSHYASAVLIRPDFADALDGLAWILVTNSDPDLRNGKEALPMSEKACELTGRKDAEKLKTLAAVYAENGRFEDALSAIQSAWDAGLHHGRTNFMAECEGMRRTFSSRQPWREPSGR
jgi:tetratricopeptide (TPR) repeat protein